MEVRKGFGARGSGLSSSPLGFHLPSLSRRPEVAHGIYHGSLPSPPHSSPLFRFPHTLFLNLAPHQPFWLAFSPQPSFQLLLLRAFLQGAGAGGPACFLGRRGRFLAGREISSETFGGGGFSQDQMSQVRLFSSRVRVSRKCMRGKKSADPLGTVGV